MATMLQAANKHDTPGLYVSRANCPAFWGTVPHLIRDPRTPEDLTGAAQHAGDACRYVILGRGDFGEVVQVPMSNYYPTT